MVLPMWHLPLLYMQTGEKKKKKKKIRKNAHNRSLSVTTFCVYRWSRARQGDIEDMETQWEKWREPEVVKAKDRDSREVQAQTL